jgi:RNA polymerase sigma-70 factor (ECF subfamily)
MSETVPPPARPVVAQPSGLDPSALWHEFGPPLRRFLARRVPPGVDPDDLLQDVFLRVVRGLDSFGGIDRPEAWLFQIARNALRDSLRARLRRDGRTDTLENDLPADPDPAADDAAEAELAPCLTAMVGRLPEPYRTAVTLTSLQGASQADVARQLGVSVSGMKSRVQRGRAQLRQMLVACCSIAVDVRGGVSDFHLRAPGACDGPTPASHSGPCTPASCQTGPTPDASITGGGRLPD